jgi:aromatic-L-amino-acid/L-tryptophan decarboxylase
MTEQSTSPVQDLGDMSAEEFRRYGYEIIDWISDYLAHPEKFPVLPNIQPGEFASKIPGNFPERGEPMSSIIADVGNKVAPALTHWNHPSFFAYFATSASSPGILGELFSAAFDVKAMLWRTSPAAIELEQIALDWLRQMMGLPESFDGIIYDTASVASMHAIAAARESLDLRIKEDGMSGRSELPLLRIYVSEEAHSSIEKAAITLGLGQRSVVKVRTDSEFRMDAVALANSIANDRAQGFLPFCVVATVGTTSTTSMDPVSVIADICEAEKLWLHVDAAYAGSAAVVPEMQDILAGCEHADSLVTNPHKWLFTPFDLSVLYSPRLEIVRRAFSLVPEYLKTTDAETVRNGMDYGIQLGRRFRALKLWMIIRYFGREGLAARIREHCRLARLFASWIQNTNGWEILAPFPFSVVCFRAISPRHDRENDEEYKRRLDLLNEQIMSSFNATGDAFMSHTRLNDRFTLRFAVGNIRTTEQHVRKAWELLNEQKENLEESRR